ncbi:unnamed protein product [Phyllotreta striolata]|uniref:Major facilitator superfamily (MFS) profile domain-containing protein n=1 Tax=Phyllotreta striolata TaxID=444603 RepID=A0A9N9XUP6_PHYSR|nr:unnamed protein product [Phyllotreta striolata]
MTATDVNPADEGKKWYEILVVLTVSLAGFNSALMYCWPSPFLVKIVHDESYHITEEEASYFTVISQVGIILLPPFIAPLANRFGRKKLILYVAIPCSIVWIIKATSKNLWMLYLARTLSGFCDAVTFSCAMVFIGEVASPKVRGIWGNSMMLSGFLGQFIINVLGVYYSVQTTAFICLAAPIIFFVAFSLVPETPYYYIAKGDDDRAVASLRSLRRRDDVEEEYKELQVAVHNQLTGTGSWKELVTVRVNRRALVAGVYVRLSQLFSGLFTFASYTMLIFDKTGTNIDPELATIVYTGVNLVVYTSVVYFSNLLGRRKSLILSMILTGVVLLAEAGYFLIDKLFPGVNLERFHWFPLAGMVGFIICSAFGVGIIPSLMLGELFPVSSKSKSLAIVTSVFGLMSLVVNNLFYYLNVYAGLSGPFLLFSLANFISAVVTYRIIPETKDKSLEQVQQQLRM